MTICLDPRTRKCLPHHNILLFTPRLSSCLPPHPSHTPQCCLRYGIHPLPSTRRPTAHPSIESALLTLAGTPPPLFHFVLFSFRVLSLYHELVSATHTRLFPKLVTSHTQTLLSAPPPRLLCSRRLAILDRRGCQPALFFSQHSNLISRTHSIRDV